MTSPPIPGRSLVTRRAVVDVVRAATLGSYGVTGFRASPLGRLLERLDLASPGLGLRLGPPLVIELELTVALGVPIAEVARQVDSAIRYAVRVSLGREVDRLFIHVGGLRLQPGASTAGATARSAPLGTLGSTGRPRPHDLADSGTDVA
ncbi:MAG: Asp23/Gls24 family envelope stress response protein [Candidatus Limnocylindrales bacterium]